jgi:hypothetical protein
MTRADRAVNRRDNKDILSLRAKRSERTPIVTNHQRPLGADLVLSLRGGQVWASWRDGRPAIRLGEHDAVLDEMRTFILQSEVAERLIGDTANHAGN